VWDLPAQDFDLLARFYAESPWGSWRDNLHAAIIARELRIQRTGKRANLDDFMFMLPDVRRKKNLTGLVDALKAMAGGHRIHISEWKPPKRGKRGRPGKTSSTPRSAVRPTTKRTRQGK
jgi:hypothetical protein